MMKGRPGALQLALYGAIAAVVLLLVVRASSGDSGSDLSPPVGTSGGGGLKIADAPRGGSGQVGGSGDAVVHVAGAVDDPGVYRLPVGSRVGDAVERAGGVSKDGDANSINLAARLADGQQVVVPAKSSVGPGGTSTATAGEGPISLGSATPEDLEQIDGIGPVTAAKITEFRDQSGGISSVEDLDQISGIGPATIEALSTRLQP